MSSAFVFFILVVAGLVTLTFWAGRRLAASQLATGVWLGIAGVGFVVVAQSYLVAAFRVIDSGTVVFVAVPAIGVLIACIAGLFAWLRNRSLNSAYRVYALTLLAFDIVALGFMGAAVPF
ncbi:MAG TPA: hypothetical protein VKE23_13675 [Candidatus Limnocylindria bacterium]|nr:hypothetical protein [Candidatus Limnocylindria bacterium]